MLFYRLGRSTGWMGSKSVSPPPNWLQQSMLNMIPFWNGITLRARA